MYVLEWWTVYALTRLLFLLFISHIATREINTRVTRQGVHKSFITMVQILFHFLHNITSTTIKKTTFTHLVSDAADNCPMLYRTQKLSSGYVKNNIKLMIFTALPFWFGADGLKRRCQIIIIFSETTKLMMTGHHRNFHDNFVHFHRDLHKGLLLLTWINFDPCMDK